MICQLLLIKEKHKWKYEKIQLKLLLQPVML